MPADDFINIVGNIQPPPGVEQQIADSGLAPNDVALLFFFNKILVIVTVVMGMWVLFNLVLAGVSYITSSGDAKAHTQVRDRLTMSVLGIVLIISAYTLTAVVSYVIFGDPNYALNPTITGPN